MWEIGVDLTDLSAWFNNPILSYTSAKGVCLGISTICKVADKWLGFVHRHGSPALLLAWAPLIGDALCVAAGWLRLNAVTATHQSDVSTELR